MPLNSPIVYTTDRSKAVVPMLFLFCVALWFILRGASCLALPCSLSMCFFCHFIILITMLGERELVFVLIVHLFVRYAHVLYHFFSSSWCQGLASTSACGFPRTFLFTYFIDRVKRYLQSLLMCKTEKSSISQRRPLTPA